MAATGTQIVLDSPAAEFRLPATNGKSYSMDDVAGERGTVVVFICNHCPYVKAVIDRMVADARVLMSEGVGFAAICSNDAASYPEDSFENMKHFAKAHDFPFPYLHDEGGRGLLLSISLRGRLRRARSRAPTILDDYSRYVLGLEGRFASERALSQMLFGAQGQLDHPLEQLFRRHAGEVADDELLGIEPDQIAKLERLVARGEDEVPVPIVGCATTGGG